MELPSSIVALAADAVPAISSLCQAAFLRFVAPSYTEGGREAFLRYVAPTAVRFRLDGGQRFFGRYCEGELVAVCELADARHIALLFVAEGQQRHGHGRALIDAAVLVALQYDPTLPALTLRASPYALPFYRRMGFVETGPLERVQGVVWTPMAKDLRPPQLQA
ncbi:MAG: GNAT family N-acetyltransferase [Myxococcota bacterium]